MLNRIVWSENAIAADAPVQCVCVYTQQAGSQCKPGSILTLTLTLAVTCSPRHHLRVCVPPLLFPGAHVPSPTTHTCSLVD